MLSEINNKTDWIDTPEFLQSWDYGEFLKSIGRNILRIKDNDLQSQCIVSKTKLGIKSVYLPRVDLRQNSVDKLLNYFNNNNYSFIQIEATNTLEIPNKFKYKKIENLQTPDTLILDTTKSEEELLADMHQKTRYNIKLARKKGVEIKYDKNGEVYWNLHLQTIERDNFVSHSKKYIEELLKLNSTYQVSAYNQNNAIAGAILLRHQDTLYYFFGASSNEDRNLMAPYLLHWEIIKLAKKLDCKYYDFWGMAEFTNENDKAGECKHGLCWKKDHPFAGVSNFKAGFGGKPKTYPEAVEIILNPFKYKLYKLIKFIKGKKIKAGHAK